MEELIPLAQEAPLAAIILLITLVTSVIFLLRGQVSRELMLHPYSFVRRNRIQTLFTSGLVHADWMHLAFNMLAFYYFAFQLEMIMVALKGPVGHVFFLLLYVLSLATSDIGTIIRHKDNPQYFSLGASGAISAVLFATIFFLPDMRVQFLFVPFPMSGIVFALVYTAVSIFASVRGQDHINHDAHLWGALTGLLFAALVFPDRIAPFWEAVKNLFG